MTETENNPSTVEDINFLEDVSDYCWTETLEAIEAMVNDIAVQHGQIKVKVIARQQDTVEVYVDAWDWSFVFDMKGHVIRGIELCHRFSDDGASLAAWAITSQVGTVETIGKFNH